MKILVFVIGMTFLSMSAFAAKVATICHGCTDYQMQLEAGKVSRVNDVINVLDFTSNKIRTFRNFVEWDPEHGAPTDIRIIPIATSQQDRQYFGQIKVAMDEIQNELDSAFIPTHVLANVWDLPKRPFAVNDVKQYISSQINVISIGIEGFKDLLQKVGFMSGELNQYWITVPNGGRLRVTFRVRGQVIIIDIVEAIDSNNNTVPFETEDVVSYRFAGGADIGPAMGAFSRLGFIVKLQKGKTTIIDCPYSPECKPKEQN